MVDVLWIALIEAKISFTSELLSFYTECSPGDTVCQRDTEKDMQGIEAIKSIHRQIDDDHNGNVDLSESDEVTIGSILSVMFDA